MTGSEGLQIESSPGLHRGVIRLPLISWLLLGCLRSAFSWLHKNWRMPGKRHGILILCPGIPNYHCLQLLMHSRHNMLCRTVLSWFCYHLTIMIHLGVYPRRPRLLDGHVSWKYHILGLADGPLSMIHGNYKIESSSVSERASAASMRHILLAWARRLEPRFAWKMCIARRLNSSHWSSWNDI